MTPVYFKRYLKDFISKIFAHLMILIAILFLGWLLFSLVKYGMPHLTLTTFTEITPPPHVPGGLLNAILGSFLMVGLAVLIGTLIGIIVAIYLSEYSSSNFFSALLRFINNILISSPSIIFGLFIYKIYVLKSKSFSGWAGIFSLTLLVFPIVIRATENVLVLVPKNMKEAAIALGVPKWRMLTFLILPISKMGIIIGIVLAFARISGETAPLLFTALNNQFMNLDLNKPMASLPVVIYQYAMSPYDDWHSLAWTGALLITLFVLMLNISVRVLFRKKIIIR